MNELNQLVRQHTTDKFQDSRKRQKKKDYAHSLLSDMQTTLSIATIVMSNTEREEKDGMKVLKFCI